ncbi:fumarylacetoacetate hydrolase family protein [Actinopolymorpha sp. B11F2]|uniref:fumarylacetoacetate hydrolase family protein n=1 Tax=Actinopolymorpha sp. B11F2 TaxID=3160862 RepID=UPI0032E513BE
MEIVRYADRSDRAVRVGVRHAGRISPVAGVSQVAELLRLPYKEVRGLVEAAAGTGDGVLDEADVLLLPPVDGRTEVWASGVTYERSKDARVEESSEKTVYEKVYDAQRPELFFKALPWRVVTDGEPIGIRADSGLDVPEPELGLVSNTFGEIVGYVVCNDVSSRVIEGENPLYLPQAKVYAGSCALSTGIRPAWEIPDATALDVALTVHRDGAPVWRGETSTARMKRTLDELVAYVLAGDAFPDGFFLATGTGVIPEMSFTLAGGDVVEIAIADVGVLSNPVVVGKEPLSWLVDALTDPFAREAVR